jgi:hypothetical protein
MGKKAKRKQQNQDHGKPAPDLEAQEIAQVAASGSAKSEGIEGAKMTKEALEASAKRVLLQTGLFRNPKLKLAADRFLQRRKLYSDAVGAMERGDKAMPAPRLQMLQEFEKELREHLGVMKQRLSPVTARDDIAKRLPKVRKIAKRKKAKEEKLKTMKSGAEKKKVGVQKAITKR